MKSKRLFQVLVLFALLFSPLGNSQHVRASSSADSAHQADAMIINRNLDFWDATYIGYVNDSIYEKWHFDFTEPHSFAVTVSTVAGDLVPLLLLQDTNGSEITHSTGTLTSTQPAGNYSIQVQPESGGGFYILTIRQITVNLGPSVATDVNPASVNVGETALATVSLNDVPAEGYTSTEFTCTYDVNVVEVSNIMVTSLFGADSAVAINGPQNGSFIVAIAGSNGNKATTSGAAFTFSVTGLQAGQTTVECKARVSKGDNVLTDLPSTAASLTVNGSTPTPAFTPTPEESPTSTFTSTPDDSSTPTFTTTPDDSFTPTPTATPDGSSTPTPDGSPTATFTLTPEESLTPTFTPEVSPTPTFTSTPEASPTPLPVGTLTGQVLAGKPVTVSLYDADNSLTASVTANSDGTFSFTAPGGTYTVFATASGYLSAQGSVTLTSGSTSTLSAISLPAGDIDNNNVIDQFDALTIGMNYNSASPAAADLNNDGIINVLDLELLARNYRLTGPVAW